MPSQLKARDIMSRNPITVPETASLADAARLLIDRRIGCLLVLNARGELSGLLTDRVFFPSVGSLGYTSGDLNQLAGMWLGDLDDLEDVVRQARSKPVREVMSTEHISVPEDAPIGDVARHLQNDRTNHVAVVSGKQPVGVISRRDLLKVFASRAG